MEGSPGDVNQGVRGEDVGGTCNGNNPCCCALRSGVYVIAGLQIFFGVMNLVVCSICVTAALHLGHLHPAFSSHWTFVAVVCGIMAVIAFLDLALGVLLYLGAKQLSPGKCRVWLIVEAVFWVLRFAHLIFLFIFYIADVSGIASTIFYLGVSFYFMWCVKVFIRVMHLQEGRVWGQPETEDGMTVAYPPHYQASYPEQSQGQEGQTPSGTVGGSSSTM